ncbi:hypothetical protein [Tamlana crocina]|uniref:Uncharacterized protein n=1 Tax=Tamlana crocina TaxID=393006 RepID=A0ABX1D8P2_9FLAO|nr:hypothetical protein [Tamlana crocina]NJX13939.1 hypothetical protein [Tamlana crocina]
MSTFKHDLKQERILNEYLDSIYHSKKLNFSRVNELEQQHRGVDVIFSHHSTDYFIDEKAQLHYLNKDLPTFTFELSYLNKYQKIKEGWLFDKSKKTHFYFLVTAILLKKSKPKLTTPNDVLSLKITSVNREKLIDHLNQIGLSRQQLDEYDFDIRNTLSFGKNIIPELNEKRAGLIYYTQHLKERPINLQLRLQYLIDKNVAKVFHH